MSSEPPDIRYLAYPVAIAIWGLSMTGRVRLTPGKAFEALVITHGFWLAWWGFHKWRQLRHIRELKAQIQDLQDRLDAAARLREQMDQNAEDGDDEQDDTDEDENDTDDEAYWRPLGPVVAGREGEPWVGDFVDQQHLWQRQDDE